MASPFDNWSYTNPMPQGNHLSTVGFGNDIFTALGINTAITSSDGTGWATGTTGAGWMHDVKQAGGFLMAVGGGGTLLKSTDGLNWTKANTKTTSTLYGVDYGRGIFVAVGDNVIAYCRICIAYKDTSTLWFFNGKGPKMSDTRPTSCF